MTTTDPILDNFRIAETALRDNAVLLKLRPPAGPYALFHHQGFALDRLLDCRLVYERMIENRQLLSEALLEERSIRERVKGDEAEAAGVQAALGATVRRQLRLTRAIRLDFESLYVFGAIFLDQWAITASYLAGLPDAEKTTFFLLSQRLESSKPMPHVLASIAPGAKTPIRWLLLQFRTLRNRFVEHADRPWQRGTIYDHHSMYFTLHLPSPPGWLDDEEVDREILQVLSDIQPSAGERFHGDAAPSPRVALQGLAASIGDVESQAHRDRIAAVLGRAGIETPPFQHLAARLAQFAATTTGPLIAAALERPDEIQLGLPSQIEAHLVAAER